MSGNQNLRTIYDLLDKLCLSLCPERRKEILKSVTTSITDSHQGFLSGLTYDESIIATKIKSHLSSKSETNLSVFVNLHEELSSLASPKFRSSILAFLLYLSDMDSKLPNTNKHFGDSVFSLPVRSHSIEQSSSMDQLYKTASSRVS